MFSRTKTLITTNQLKILGIQTFKYKTKKQVNYSINVINEVNIQNYDEVVCIIFYDDQTKNLEIKNLNKNVLKCYKC